MLKKMRGLGKGFFVLSALLLMFLAVGCDDSDSTQPTSKGDANVVEPTTTKASVAPTKTVTGVNAATGIPADDVANLKIIDSEFDKAPDADEKAVVTATVEFINDGADVKLFDVGGFELGGDVAMDAATSDSDSAGFINDAGDKTYKDTWKITALPEGFNGTLYDVTGGLDFTDDDDKDVEWETAGVIEITIKAGDTPVKSFSKPLSVALKLDPEAYVPGTKTKIKDAAEGTSVVVWRKEDNEAWEPFKKEMIIGGKVNFTTDTLTTFSVQGASPRLALRITLPDPGDACAFDWTVTLSNKKTVITKVTFDESFFGSFIKGVDDANSNSVSGTGHYVGSTQGNTTVSVYYLPTATANENAAKVKTKTISYDITCESGAL